MTFPKFPHGEWSQQPEKHTKGIPLYKRYEVIILFTMPNNWIGSIFHIVFVKSYIKISPHGCMHFCG